MPPNRRIPCELVRCDPTRDENACGLLQMRHSVPPEILYSSYWYVSGTNQTMRDHLAGIAKSAIEICPTGSVLDIGCNDLTLLNYFSENYWVRFGIDPSDVKLNAHSGKINVVHDLFPSLKLGRKKFDIITSIAMFYDLEDPVNFAENIRSYLKPEGVWILEMAYLPTMLANNSYDTICHEHLEYYSLSVLERIMEMAKLKIFRAELNAINGGSIRCYVCPEENLDERPKEWGLELKRIREAEFDMELDTDKPYASFQSRIENHRDELMVLLRELKQAGKTIHLYGASTKGNTLLQWCGIDARMIDCAADRNPEKNQAMTLGTCIQIVSEEESRSRQPDYYLVLPWHFSREILERERPMIDSGTKFIFPLPHIHIVGKESNENP
jgi:SAM-dependent methyltransferase